MADSSPQACLSFGARPSVEFQFEGQTYFLSRVTLGDRADYKRWANAIVKSEIDEMRAEVVAGRLDPAEFARQEKSADRDIRAGYYDLYQEGGRQMFDRGGFAQLALICLRRHRPEVTMELLERIVMPDGGAMLWAKYQEANLLPPVSPSGPTSSPPEKQ